MATTLADIRRKIHEYYLDSEKREGEESLVRKQGEYPNAVILTEEQYTELIRELFKLSAEVEDNAIFDIKILAIEGLEVIFTEYIEEPKVIRLSN